MLISTYSAGRRGLFWVLNAPSWGRRAWWGMGRTGVLLLFSRISISVVQKRKCCTGDSDCVRMCNIHVGLCKCGHWQYECKHLPYIYTQSHYRTNMTISPTFSDRHTHLIWSSTSHTDTYGFLYTAQSLVTFVHTVLHTHTCTCTLSQTHYVHTHTDLHTFHTFYAYTHTHTQVDHWHTLNRLSDMYIHHIQLHDLH